MTEELKNRPRIQLSAPHEVFQAFELRLLTEDEARNLLGFEPKKPIVH